MSSPYTFDRNIELVVLDSEGTAHRTGILVSTLEAERFGECGLDTSFELSLQPTPEALVDAEADGKEDDLFVRVFSRDFETIER